jgi:hypothetical protein
LTLAIEVEYISFPRTVAKEKTTNIIALDGAARTINQLGKPSINKE